MSHIHWDKPFFFDPMTGMDAPGTPGAVPFPTYGNYGGAGYSAGAFGGMLLTKPDGSAYSYAQLLQIGNDGQDPVDRLDYLFYVHDLSSAASGSDYSDAQAAADAALLNGMVALNTDDDPEASLYAGAAELAMLGDLGIHEKLGLLSPAQALAALKDAAHDLQFGLDHLPQAELTVALNTMFHSTSTPNVFRFDFAITTDSFAQEFYEMSVMKTLGAILDMGEGNHPAVDTGFPYPGTTEYGFTYNTVTHDFGLVN